MVDLAMGASTICARLGTGDIVAATPAEVRDLLGQPMIQAVYSSTSADTTSTTIVPFDDTIPGQGNPDGATTGLSVTITPDNTANILEVGWACMVSSETANIAIVGVLYQDSIGPALAASSLFASAVNGIGTLNGVYTMTAGTGSATTFKLWFGPHSAATVHMNGISTGRVFGAIPKSVMWVKEYQV